MNSALPNSATPPSPQPTGEGGVGVSTDQTPRDRVLILLLVGFLIALGYRWFDGGRGSARPLSDGYQQRIDLNSAGRAELQQLPGIGPAKAERIVAGREAQSKPLDLRAIPGFGEKSVQRLDSYVRTDPSDAEPDRLTRRQAAPPSGSPGKKALPEPESVPINTAPVEVLQRLPGIGAVLAQRIVAERERKPFANPEDLRRVGGIGPKKLEQIRPLVRFD